MQKAVDFNFDSRKKKEKSNDKLIRSYDIDSSLRCDGNKSTPDIFNGNRAQNNNFYVWRPNFTESN